MDSQGVRRATIPSSDRKLLREAGVFADGNGLDRGRVSALVIDAIRCREEHGEIWPTILLDYIRDLARSVGPEVALEAVEREDPIEIVRRTALPEYLAHEDTPLYTFEELAQLIARFRGFLEENRTGLLKAGYPRRVFAPSRWLYRYLGRLYYLKIRAPRNGATASRPDVDYSNIWLLQEATGARRHNPSTHKLAIDYRDAARLERGRAEFLNLKLQILARLERSLRDRSVSGVWEDCLRILVLALSRRQVEFYLRQDRFYRGLDATVEGAALIRPSPQVSSTLPGGLSDLLEVIGHCEFELRSGTMDATKRDLVALAREVSAGDWRAVFGSSYFAILSKPWRTQFDEILDRFQERQIVAALSGFWDEYRHRVNRAVADEFDRNVAYRTTIKEKHLALFEPQVRAVGDFLKVHLETTGTLPALQFSYPSSADSSPRNFLRRMGENWEIEFEGARISMRDSKGMRHISQLLQRAGTAIHVLHLARLSLSGDLTHPLVDSPELTEDALTREGLSIGRPRDLGPTNDATAEAEYKRHLERLREELSLAAEGGDSERVQRLEDEHRAVERHLKAGFGRGGRPRMEKNPADRVRKAVTGSIKWTICRIADSHSRLGLHLSNSIETGVRCCYRPEQPTPWTIDTSPTQKC